MKVHWCTEDRWLRMFREGGKSFAQITRGVFGDLYRLNHPIIQRSLRVQVEDAIRRAIRRRERKGK